MKGAVAASRDPKGIDGLDVAISIIVMFNLAISYPVLDLLGRSPEFFIAHEWTGGDTVVLGLLLTLVVPIALGGLLWLTFATERRVGSAGHILVFCLLTTSLALQVLKMTAAARADGTLLMVIAVALGALVTTAFFRSRGFRSFVRMGLFVPVLVLAVFLFASPVKELVWPSTPAEAARSSIGEAAPIVMVVMDELPLASLLDGRGHIDADLFPNLARFSHHSTWFPNATTVHNMTPKAVPALLDGRYPVQGSLPVLSDHPDNVFTLLAGSYRLRVEEQLTDLCPKGLCESIGRALSGAQKWNAGVSDLEIVLAHILLPSDLAESLPPVDEGWAGFDDRETIAESTSDPLGDFRAFIRALDSANEPQMYFLHLMLPHPPWRFLPSGEEYPETASPLAGFAVRDNGDKRWSDDAWLVAQAYQRHLLQVGFLDKLIGKLVHRLREVGLYEESMIILTSDHGAVFRSGLSKRAVTPRTLGNIAAIPLFVKRPSQKRGRIDHKPAQSIDVYPTIADEVGARPSSGIDGTSLFDSSRVSRVKRYIYSAAHKVEIHDVFGQATRAARHKYGLFRIDRGLDGLFDFGPGSTGRWVGRKINRLPHGLRFPGFATVASLPMYRDVIICGRELPAMLSGRLETELDTRSPLRVAVGLNGTLWGMTRTFGENGETGSFYVVLPSAAFVEGRNRLQLFVVGRRGTGLFLRPLNVRGG